jgi:hypothetical protein
MAPAVFKPKPGEGEEGAQLDAAMQWGRRGAVGIVRPCIIGRCDRPESGDSGLCGSAETREE